MPSVVPPSTCALLAAGSECAPPYKQNVLQLPVSGIRADWSGSTSTRGARALIIDRVAIELRPKAVQARLGRAQRHVGDLEQVLAAYVARPPFRIARRTGDWPRMIDRAELIDEPPIEAAMIVSDAAHQARAALDNLVNGLRPDGPTSGVHFPIRATEPEYKDAIAKGALRGVPDWAQDAIAALQPFSTDFGRWAGRELPNLHELARIDRHRVPPIHAGVVIPDDATGGEMAGVVARMDSRGRWAEWEYVPGDVGRVTFRVEVLFGPDSGQPPGVEVADWTAYLVRMTGEAVDMVLRSAS